MTMKAKRLSFFSALFVFSFSLLSCGPSISSSQSELSSSSTSIADSTSSQNSSESGISSSPSSSGSSISYSEPKYDDISFHFLELGNAKTGDSIFIKAGNTDILIDAGSYYNSYSSISTAINQYCTDGILEYVIATHGSDTSSSPDFLKTLHPEEAIISVGAKNRYGHPSKAVLSQLTRLGIKIRRTDIEGTITYRKIKPYWL